jgi:uncharacterized membrane protein
MVSFSEAAFVIAITLLVIEIKIPLIDRRPPDAALVVALAPIIPNVVGFLVSFLPIGEKWIEHYRICTFIEGFDPARWWSNLWLLLFVAFLPLTAGVLSEYYDLNSATWLYAAAFGAPGVAKASFWH